MGANILLLGKKETASNLFLGWLLVLSTVILFICINLQVFILVMSGCNPPDSIEHVLKGYVFSVTNCSGLQPESITTTINSEGGSTVINNTNVYTTINHGGGATGIPLNNGAAAQIPANSTVQQVYNALGIAGAGFTASAPTATATKVVGNPKEAVKTMANRFSKILCFF